MNATDATLKSARPAARAAAGTGTRRIKLRAYWELTKPGITRMVLLTTAAGFYLGNRGPLDPLLLFNLLLGTGLAAGGTNALNQWWERDADARMRRTARRPLPSCRLTPKEALIFASAISALGIGYLAAFVSFAAASVVAASLVSYVFLYTPLKKVTPAALYVGAVPGALPIVAGWVAAGGALDAAAWALFSILFLWQLPHFLALGWMHRDDYARGGFRMVSGLERGGRRIAARVLLFTVLLLLSSLAPGLRELAGPLYVAGALGVGTAFVLVSARLMLSRELANARRVFIGSLAYLPVLLIFLIVGKALT